MFIIELNGHIANNICQITKGANNKFISLKKKHPCDGSNPNKIPHKNPHDIEISTLFGAFQMLRPKKNVHFINPMGFVGISPWFSHGHQPSPSIEVPEKRAGTQFRTVVAGVQVQGVHLSPRLQRKELGFYQESMGFQWDFTLW